ncbi:MAG: LysE family translocator [Alcaligenaceae bacterium]|nr:LysE family translocator [Alcaligenaceae bacterium]
MTPETLFLFFGLCALLAISPGPDNIFVLLQTALNGYRTGFMIVLGLCTGLLFHTFIVTVGIAGLIAASDTAFTLLKLLGAAYLLYMAWGALRAGPVKAVSQDPHATTKTLNNAQFYRRGILMNITNPKVSLFFLAFLPQFTNATTGQVKLQLVILSGIFILAAFLVFCSIVLFSGYFGQLLKRSDRAQKILNRFTALVFVGLAARLALSSR